MASLWNYQSDDANSCLLSNNHVHHHSGNILNTYDVQYHEQANVAKMGPFLVYWFAEIVAHIARKQNWSEGNIVCLQNPADTSIIRDVQPSATRALGENIIICRCHEYLASDSLQAAVLSASCSRLICNGSTQLCSVSGRQGSRKLTMTRDEYILSSSCLSLLIVGRKRIDWQERNAVIIAWVFSVVWRNRSGDDDLIFIRL